MSAPQTNLEKQKRWHRAPLVGMAAGIIFVGVMFLWLTGVFGPTSDKALVPVDGVTVPAAEGATAPAVSAPTEAAPAAPTAAQPAPADPAPAQPGPAQTGPVEN